jgi:hypothetical protein
MGMLEELFSRQLPSKQRLGDILLDDSDGEQADLPAKGKSKWFRKGDSYFGECERDDEGHCKPSGQSGESGHEEPPGDNDAGDVGKPLATPEEIERRVKPVRPRQITPVNMAGGDPRSQEHVEEIAESMREDGWQGPPLLAMRDEEGNWQAWTGSHRLTAAQLAELDEVPAVWIDKEEALQWAAAAGYDLPPDADFTDLEDEDRWKILQAGDDSVAAEIMRQEVEKWE